MRPEPTNSRALRACCLKLAEWFTMKTFPWHFICSAAAYKSRASRALVVMGFSMKMWKFAFAAKSPKLLCVLWVEEIITPSVLSARLEFRNSSKVWNKGTWYIAASSSGGFMSKLYLLHVTVVCGSTMATNSTWGFLCNCGKCQPCPQEPAPHSTMRTLSSSTRLFFIFGSMWLMLVWKAWNHKKPQQN